LSCNAGGTQGAPGDDSPWPVTTGVGQFEVHDNHHVEIQILATVPNYPTILAFYPSLVVNVILSYFGKATEIASTRKYLT